MAEVVEPLVIAVCKADRTVDPIRPAILQITGDLPEGPPRGAPESVWRPACLAQYRVDAERIMQALESLPGGTRDQLLILMLEKTASLFRVPFSRLEEVDHG
jgi:hypothetical protein